ncbi:L,D-transpeptidase family protein [Parasediminibacterium sp. JCM 36343]|uniref:L,D-transpeptidase family protein n=1 Tax=Parasediminibacterium sp. JCM 36343 TaxID=3374279 RepID=UPI00397BA392
MKKSGLFILLFSLLLVGCKHCGRKKAAKDSSITTKNAYNNLFLDSSSLENFIGKHEELEKYRDEFFDFYTHRNFEYAWFDTSGMIEQAHSFYNLQNSYIATQNDSSIYNPQLQHLYEQQYGLLFHKKKGDTTSFYTEVWLTAQFFKYAAKVYEGNDIDAKELGWFIPRKKIDIPATLNALINEKSASITQYEPLNTQYRLLEKYLATYYGLKKQARWDSIPAAKSYKMGDSSSNITLIKKRLFQYGDLKAKDTSQYFDSSLVIAVKQFQDRLGLNNSGKIGAATLKELNRPIDTLIRKLLINMERSRWMLPDTAQTDRIVVNIPEYKLYVYDSGKYSFNMDVVVGTAANSTVIFNGNLRYIVFSPYWNVTEDITKREVMPAMKRNPNYLQKNNMEITGYNNGIPQVRQKPGPNNSLGGVKFLFPNSYNIYLHDTPFKEAFASSKRSFSHGCIRLGQPAKLAQFLLRREPQLTADSIKTLMTLAKEKWFNAKPTVPVTIKYFTAWVDAKGLLNFREDIYGHDKKMAEKLF